MTEKLDLPDEWGVIVRDPSGKMVFASDLLDRASAVMLAGLLAADLVDAETLRAAKREMLEGGQKP